MFLIGFMFSFLIVGTYSDAKAGSCSQCQAGYECSDPANPAECSVGEYSLQGTVSATKVLKIGTSEIINVNFRGQHRERSGRYCLS